MSWIGKLFGRPETKPDREPPPPAPRDPKENEAGAPLDVDTGFTAALGATMQLRDAYWSGVGAVESEVITYLLSPSLMGGPAWPTTRQAYRVVRTPHSIIIATDGMADPFDDGAEGPNGFEAELFIETADIPAEFAGRPGQIDSLKLSWAFAVLQQMAAIVAEGGGVSGLLDRHGIVSVELPGMGTAQAVSTQVPNTVLTEDGTIGLLLGLPVAGRDERIEEAPLSPIRLVAVTLLSAAELEYVRSGPDDARLEIAERLKAQPQGHFSALFRPSTV